MKKRVISFMFAMVFVSIFSTAGFAYNVDAWAGITGGKMRSPAALMPVQIVQNQI